MTKQNLVIKYIYDLKNKNKIKDGEFIPSENSLIIQMNFSRNTIRGALKKLAEANILIPIKGKGYLFNDSKSLTLKSFKDQYGKLAKTIFIKERFVKKYDEILDIHGYWEFIKVRYIGNIPFILTYQRIKDITMRTLPNSYKKSLFKALREKGEKISFAKKKVEYIKTPKESKILLSNLPNHSVLLTSETKDINNNTIEVSYNYYNPENFSWEWIEKTYE